MEVLEADGTFHSSSHARHWIFSDASQLTERRNTARTLASSKLQEGGQEDSGEALSPLSSEDEVLLRYWYETKLQELCKDENSRDPKRFTNRVLSAAQMYFKRFYLMVSPMEEEPKGLMLAALYVAGKVEEERITVEDLVPKYAKNLQAEDLLALEMRLMEALRFQLVTCSPFRCLAGLMHDLQSSINLGADTKIALEDLHRSSTEWLCQALCTDAPFLHSPQQIALTALHIAGRARSAENGVDVLGWMGRRFDRTGPACEDAALHVGDGRSLLMLLPQLGRVEELCTSSVANLAEEQTLAHLKRADAQLRKLTKAIRCVEKAQKEQRQASEELERQRQKRARVDACKEQQLDAEAQLQQARESFVLHKRRRASNDAAGAGQVKHEV